LVRVRYKEGVDDLAPEALQWLLPHLGPLVRDPERVDGQHSDHPGQAFDYAAQRRDGQELAIEITRAWDHEWLGAQSAWRKLATHVQAAVQQQYPTVTGWYTMAVPRTGNPKAKKYDAETLADKVSECFDAGMRMEIAVDQAVKFRYVYERRDLVVDAVRSSWEFEGGPENEARFRTALEAKIPTMRRAGEAGYETHLAVVHWVLGSTHGWRESLTKDPPDAPYPEHIWAIDLNARGGTQGRQPVEHIWPLPDGDPGVAQ
jgi:hypothetical protein